MLNRFYKLIFKTILLLPLLACVNNESDSFVLVTDAFEMRSDLETKQYDQLVQGLETFSRSGNTDASVMLATVYMEQVSLMQMCLDSEACTKTELSGNLWKYVDQIYSLLSDAVANDKGHFEFAIFSAVESSKYYSLDNLFKHMHLAAESKDLRAIRFLASAYEFGMNGFPVDENMSLKFKYELDDLIED